MESILTKNSNGSIDINDKYGFTDYTVDKYENGIIARLANALYEYESFFNSERFKEVLMDFFDVPSDTYTYNLTREKSAFELGTVSIEDFEEFTENTIDNMVTFIREQF